MGAVKAGVTIVTFDEKENQDALDHALGHTKAKGLIISPSTQIEGAMTRKSLFLDPLMPELEASHFGDEHNFSRYPHLKTVV